jgi:hypothetical protein
MPTDMKEVLRMESLGAFFEEYRLGSILWSPGGGIRPLLVTSSTIDDFLQEKRLLELCDEAGANPVVTKQDGSRICLLTAIWIDRGTLVTYCRDGVFHKCTSVYACLVPDLRELCPLGAQRKGTGGSSTSVAVR